MLHGGIDAVNTLTSEKPSLNYSDMHTTGNLQRQVTRIALSLFEGAVLTIAVALVSFALGYPARTWPSGAFEALLVLSCIASFFFRRNAHLREAEEIASAQRKVTAWHRWVGFFVAAIVALLIGYFTRGVA